MEFPTQLKDKLIEWYNEKNPLIIGTHLDNKINHLMTNILHDVPDHIIEMTFNKCLKLPRIYGIGVIVKQFEKIKNSWTTKQVCQYLNITGSTLKRHIRNGYLKPYKKFGFANRFDIKECKKLKENIDNKKVNKNNYSVYRISNIKIKSLKKGAK